MDLKNVKDGKVIESRIGRIWKTVPNLEVADESEETVAYEIVGKNRIKYNSPEKLKIGILTVIKSKSQIKDYEVAMTTVKCYAKIQNYNYILAIEKDFDCSQSDQFSRNLCILQKILPTYDVILLLDIDIGVVYPKRRIEEFLYRGFDIVFYRNFYNFEIMTKSLIVRNTKYVKEFLKNLSSELDSKPTNGIRNFYFSFAERVFPDEKHTIALCRMVKMYKACLHTIFGVQTDLEKVKVLKKGSGWARDSYLTNSVWNKENDDFMLHGWKNDQKRVKEGHDKIPIYRGSMFEWYNPLTGPIHLDKCNPKNMSWSYDEGLIGDIDEINAHFDRIEQQDAKEQLQLFSEMGKLVNDTMK